MPDARNSLGQERQRSDRLQIVNESFRKNIKSPLTDSVGWWSLCECVRARINTLLFLGTDDAPLCQLAQVLAAILHKSHKFCSAATTSSNNSIIIICHNWTTHLFYTCDFPCVLRHTLYVLYFRLFNFFISLTNLPSNFLNLLEYACLRNVNEKEDLIQSDEVTLRRRRLL